MNVRVDDRPLYIPAQVGSRQYVPAPGETLLDVANRFGVSLADLQAANPGRFLATPGVPLNLPQDAQQGETTQLGMENLESFAARHGVSVEQLAAYNGLEPGEITFNTPLTLPPPAAQRPPPAQTTPDPSALTPEQLRDAQTLEEGRQILSDLKYLTRNFDDRGLFLGASGVNSITIQRVDAVKRAIPALDEAVASNDPAQIRRALYDPAITELRSIEGSPRALASLQSDVKAYAKHYQQLAWRLDNLGRLGTPEQQQQAINNFTQNNPEWAAENRRLETAVVEQGKSLIQQVSYLRTLPSEQADRRIQELLADPNARLAMDLAMRTDPSVLASPTGVRFMQSVANTAKLSDQTQKFAKEVGNLYLGGVVRGLTPEVGSSNPGRVQLADTQIERLKNGPLADLLGVDQKKFASAIEAMRESLPQPSDSVDDALARQRNFNQLLETDDFRGAFGKSTDAGQQLRLLSLAFSLAGAGNSLTKAIETGSLKDWGKTVGDTLGLAQKSHELLAGLGKLKTDTVYGSINSTWAGRLCNVISAAFDGWNAVNAFSEGDQFRGSMYTMSAAGTIIAAGSGTTLAASWGVGAACGPVGIGLVALATAGLLYADYRDMTQFETPESVAFLEDMGLRPEAAQVFMDQNWGGSAVPALARYAELKGYDLRQPEQQQAFVYWVNGLTPDQLSAFCARLHQFSGTVNGDARQMSSDTTVVIPTEQRVRTGLNYARTGVPVYETVQLTPRSVGNFDAYLMREGATPLASRY